MTAEPSRQRIVGLDGLRAVAVLAVLFFHLDLPGAQLGWAGVELFYVLSGFLITRILLDLRMRPAYFRTFYVRRALRILPIYFLVIAVTAILALATHRPETLTTLPYYLLYLQNYYPQIASLNSDGIPLTNHTWTLAVEEQFYWLWPIVILVTTGRTLRAVLLAMFLAAPAARLGLLLWTGNPVAGIASLVAQIDALAAGAFLATVGVPAAAKGLLARWGGASAAAGVVLLFLLVDVSGLAAFAEPTVWAARPVNVLVLSGMALLFGGVTAVTLVGIRPVTAVLAFPPLAHLGRISYGLYLYYPLALFFATVVADLISPNRSRTERGLFLTAGAVLLNYLIALASWRYLEQPILRHRNRSDGADPVG